eukprot:CAMPEP_0201488250 /NCGR_PEP_ID=MMETSP0151_2-20130828/17850_1 /ASSEMBLY_ACC=CAM_ASM_000257 /TAXON_ID=200890 /ORGANISM="Paramoeba atlantica, Strain 621/1 / CCAP 1560/9" /LENGTH=392 /DNA_ID=CAMNT_0047873507 /DNA_START=6 /DNA_END=1184 /DNA_ORIENTATION=+
MKAGWVLFFFAALMVATCFSESLKVNVYYPSKEFARPSSTALYLRGDNAGLNWDKGLLMTPDQKNDDHWYILLNFTKFFSAGSRLEMKVLINDATWQVGCNYRTFLPNNHSEVNLYPFFKTLNGQYEVTQDKIQPPPGSNILPRKLVIYTPPSYNENTYKTYRNVLVMHDGQNLFNDRTSFLGVSWRCQDTVDRLVGQGDMEEIIIVGVYNTDERIDDYTYSVDPDYGGGNGDAYLDFLEQSVYPYVQANYRVQGMAQQNLGILGSSLGGLISCYAGWTRGEVYSKGGCMSSSFWWNDEDFNNVILNTYDPPNHDTYQVYLDSGNVGGGQDDLEETIRVRDHIVSLGYTGDVNEFYFLDDGGQHSEYFWGQRFYKPCRDLYPPTYAEPLIPV